MPASISYIGKHKGRSERVRNCQRYQAEDKNSRFQINVEGGFK